MYIVGAWNPYTYCLGNPVSLRDPSGGSFWNVLEDIGIALVATVCVVGAIFTGGASLFGLAAMTSLTTIDFMTGVAIGTFGAALAGAASAQNAGGNIWEGAFVGALVGGATSLLGGALGAAVANAINATSTTWVVGIGVVSTTVRQSFFAFVVSGLIQGTIAGAGTGFATGFAGGKGSGDAMLKAMAQGALWGGTLGGLMGLGIGVLRSVGTPSNFINGGNFIEKFGQANVSSVDNVANSMQGTAQFFVPGQGGFDASNVGGFLTNFISTGTQASGWFSIPLYPLDEMVTNAGLAATVDVSMAADQLGFSYADLIVALSGAVPIWDLVVAQLQLSDSSEMNKIETTFNQSFGSGNPNSV
jgi:hypothetical protein